MPWHITKGGGTCNDSEWAVIKDSDGSTEGCHDTKAEAQRHMDALYANESAARSNTAMALLIEQQGDQYCVVDDENPDAAPDCYDTRAEAQDAIAAETADASASGGTGFTVFIVAEGVETIDGRLFELESLKPREVLPVPLMFQNRAEHGGIGGDTTSYFIGAIEEVFRDPRDETRWMGRGHLSTSEGAQLAELDIRAGLRMVSVDAMYNDVTLDVRKVDEEGWPVDILYRFSESTIMGATVTPMQALDTTTLWFDDQEEPAHVANTHGEEVPLTTEPEVVEAPAFLFASGALESPPAAWFENPTLSGPTALSVDPEGHITGHIATWSTCHIGQPGQCVTAPISPSSYAYFHTGEVICAGGERVAVGNLTLGTGHADIGDTANAALAHYDHTGTAVADVRAGEDDHGIWIAGSVRPGLTQAETRALCAASPSGDWRRINGALELVAVLCVNVPGFPVPRTMARIASGAETALVAAAGPRPNPAEPFTAEGFTAWLEAAVARLVESHLDRVGYPTPEEQVTAEAAEVVDEALTRLKHVSAPPLVPATDTARERAVKARKREIKAQAALGQRIALEATPK
jgi:hypothetical protein